MASFGNLEIKPCRLEGDSGWDGDDGMTKVRTLRGHAGHARPSEGAVVARRDVHFNSSGFRGIAQEAEATVCMLKDAIAKKKKMKDDEARRCARRC